MGRNYFGWTKQPWDDDLGKDVGWSLLLWVWGWFWKIFIVWFGLNYLIMSWSAEKWIPLW